MTIRPTQTRAFSIPHLDPMPGPLCHATHLVDFEAEAVLLARPILTAPHAIGTAPTAP